MEYRCILEGSKGYLIPEEVVAELQFHACSSEKLGSQLHSSFLGAAAVAPCRARGEW